MKKIAPKLQAFVPRLAHRDAAEGEYHAGLLAELRDLLAVARAAAWWYEADAVWERGSPADKLKRAIARLDRASTGEGR